MGRIIHTENLATDRNRLMKAMAIASRELAKQAGFTSEARDLAAFLVLALDEVNGSIERSVAPWEKRGYWLKADRFRMDWAWVEPIAQQMRAALMIDDIPAIAQNMAVLGQRLGEVQVPAKHRLGTPWDGAWGKMLNKAQR